MERLSGSLLLSMLLAFPVAAGAQVLPPPDTAPAPVACAVLFYSPACPHCRDLIAHGLPPILQRFGDRFVMVGLDVTTEGGQAQYQAMVRRFAVPPDRQGVPTVVIGSRVLVGSEEIPSQLPGLIERGLSAGGVGWPDVPLLRQALAAHGILTPHGAAAENARAGRAEAVAAPTPHEGGGGAGEDTAMAAAAPAAAAADTAAKAVPAPGRAAGRSAAPAPKTERPVAAARPRVVAAQPTAAEPSPAASVPPGTSSAAAPVLIGGAEERQIVPFSVADRFLADPVGNAASVVVLLAMTTGLALVLGAVRGGVRIPRMPSWTVPSLAVVGIGVAAYLSFVEMTGVRAVCGPVGDCNTVQQSAYARLLGIPIGMLGLGGYVAVIAAWVVGVRGRARFRGRAWLAIWAMALIGTAFSMYLTFLEPFVIGATCAWCLTSAVIITLILLAATPPAGRIVRSGPATGA
jgi:uncharacterized membrane protein